MPSRDTLDKVIPIYMASVCAKPFTYKGKTYHPRPLRVSPLIFRGFTCPPNCGACCPRFSLDYLPHEELPSGVTLVPRQVVVNSEEKTILSDLQLDHNDHHCKNVSKKDGRCSIHGKQPFSCDFELIRFMQSKQGRGDMLIQRLYGRGWQMLRVDGRRRALCEMTPVDDFTVGEVVRKLKRLKQWTDHFGIVTKMDEIITWAESGPHDQPLCV